MDSITISNVRDGVANVYAVNGNVSLPGAVVGDSLRARRHRLDHCRAVAESLIAWQSIQPLPESRGLFLRWLTAHGQNVWDKETIPEVLSPALRIARGPLPAAGDVHDAAILVDGQMKSLFAL